MAFHTIAERSVEIDVTDYNRHHDETTFMDLNDDCIHEILSTECLNAFDLSSVAENSPRLKDIAGRIFRRKYAKCDLNSLVEGEPKSAQRILRNFGTVISDLEIDGWHFGDKGTSVLKCVARHCSIALESLSLDNCVIPDNFPAKLTPIFNNLRILKINNCTFEGASKELFADCGSLVELELIIGDVGFIIENTFPKLQKFKCAAGGTYFDSFILRHKNLTSIAIFNYCRMSSLLLLLADHCKLLEELTLIISGDQIFDLSSLGHLRKLYIECNDRDVMKAVQGWNNLQFLEQLTLRAVNVEPELIQTLSKRLKVLKLFDCCGLENLYRTGDSNQLTELDINLQWDEDLDFVLLIQRLSNLKVLSVREFGFEMDLETYLRIVDVVRARPAKSKLTIKFDYELQCDADMCHSFSHNTDKVEVIF